MLHSSVASAGPEQIVATGFLVRGALWPVHTYGDREPATEAEKYELTISECETMQDRLLGKPVIYKHNHATPGLDPVVLGKIVNSKYDRATGDWQVSMQLEGPEARLVWEAFVERARIPLALSLSHNRKTLEPEEVSLCREPARYGAYITNGPGYNALDASPSDKMDTSPGSASKAAPEGKSKGEKGSSAPMDQDSKDSKRRLMEKIIGALSEDERKIYVSQQIALMKDKKAKAEMEKELEKMKREKMTIAQTYASALVDALQRNGSNTEGLKEDLQERHMLDATAAYFPALVEACQRGAGSVKQPALDPQVNQFLQMAEQEDVDDRKEQRSFMANQYHGQDSRLVEASKPDAGNAYMRAFMEHLEASELTSPFDSLPDPIKRGAQPHVDMAGMGAVGPSRKRLREHA